MFGSIGELVKASALAGLGVAKAIELSLRLRRKNNAEPALLYAGQVPSFAAKPSGGKVKLAYLAQSFPELFFEGNILYFVSSCLPRSALSWARAAKRQGIRIVLNQNGVAYPAWANPAQMSKVNKRNRAIAELADHIIFQSDFCQRSFSHWVGTNPASSSVIYNPVDTARFHLPAAARDADLLLMGSSQRPERIQLALGALAEAKQNGRIWRLRVAGKFLWRGAEGDFSRWLEELGIAGQVERLGVYSQDSAPGIFGSAKVLLHLQDKDASPTVPLEAMACGTPVLTIASGGLPELIPADLGRLLPVAESWDEFCYPDVKAIAKAADDLILRADSLSAGCAAHVRNKFSLRAFTQAHEDLFGRVLAKSAEKAS